MKPRPWSFSSLDNFTTCARKYHAEAILKIVPREETEAQTYGTWAHKQFEDRLGPLKKPLVQELEHHEPLMIELEREGGRLMTERKVGINKRLEPCDFFARDVWWRGVIDVEIRRPDNTIRITDYKTGKKKPKVDQLKLFSIYGLISGAERVDSEFYWTQDRSFTKYVMPAAHLGALLSGFVPALQEYADAFKLDIWPPKRNGLCKNYCGVVGCEFRGMGMNER